MSKKKEISLKKEDQKELQNCPRCGRRMSWFETDDGSAVPWCYWENYQYLDPKLGANK